MKGSQKKKDFKGKLHNYKTSGKTKNKTNGCLPEGHITDPRNKKMEEMTRRKE